MKISQTPASPPPARFVLNPVIIEMCIRYPKAAKGMCSSHDHIRQYLIGFMPIYGKKRLKRHKILNKIFPEQSIPILLLYNFAYRCIK